MLNANPSKEWLTSWDDSSHDATAKASFSELHPHYLADLEKESAKRSWESRLSLLIFLVCILLLCGAAFLRTWARSDARRFSFLFDRELKSQEILSESTKRLRLQMATLRSPNRISRIALNELKINHDRII